MDRSHQPNDGEISRFRRILPQFIACIVKNMLIVNTGSTYAVPAILIAAMTGVPNEHNRNEYISITPVHASWLGAMSYLIQPIGSLLSILITDSLGRKRSMVLVNIPFALGWFMLHQGDAVWKIFTGCASFGLAAGLMEAPLITYLGEIW
ncbi:facilitated trehalose transporter Tret1-like [Sitodiplosis mosellana]|uniref:facilitated trehalose transporter Tret1-like n=1 Tax=Sitodiplosis mosellana TaxID=263140 RepID=UPI002443B2DF|nr:facilitated trehalose transporter Tret1-like [Sitodiplosis mosellana]